MWLVGEILSFASVPLTQPALLFTLTLTADLSRSMSNRQQFVQQYSENDMVLKVRDDGDRFVYFFFLFCVGVLKDDVLSLPICSVLNFIQSFDVTKTQELEKLDEDANVFKLIGPVLIKQDLVEAKSNVGKRLEFIQNET